MLKKKIFLNGWNFVVCFENLILLPTYVAYNYCLNLYKSNKSIYSILNCFYD